MKLIRAPFLFVAWLFRKIWWLLLALLIVASIRSVDCSAPDWDDLEPSQPETRRSRQIHMQNCALAHREFGPDIYVRRPDCRKYLPAPPAER